MCCKIIQDRKGINMRNIKQLFRSMYSLFQKDDKGKEMLEIISKNVSQEDFIFIRNIIHKF